MDGYIEAAKASDTNPYAEMFTARAGERRRVVSQLQTEVVRLGGKPEDDGTVLASAHRTFLDLKAAVFGRDNTVIVNEVERGEDHILHTFEAAMKDEDLSPEPRAAVQSAFWVDQDGPRPDARLEALDGSGALVVASSQRQGAAARSPVFVYDLQNLICG